MKSFRALMVAVVSAMLFLSLLSPALASTIVIQPGSEQGEDAFVYGAEPGSNFGADEELRLGIYRNAGDNEHRAFIRFNLSEIPLGSLVTSAGLYLYHFTEENGYYYLTLNAHRILESWSETGVTWNDQPAFDPIPESSNFFDRYHLVPDWHEWNLTSLTQSWMDGVYDNHGISLNVTEPSQGYSTKFCYSSEYNGDPALRPKLVVDYTVAPPLTTVEFMIACVEKSREEGLIDDDEVAQALREKLTAISEKLNADKGETASNILSAFINSVVAQRGKHIAVEIADILVKNAQFVMGSLED